MDNNKKIKAGLIVGLTGFDLLPAEKDILHDNAVCGVILYSKNYNNKEQLQKLIIDIRAINDKLIICADHEGGRVQRFVEPGVFTNLPAMGDIGNYYDKDPGQAEKLAHAIGVITGYELAINTGINLSLSPVVDLNINKQVIGDRSFSNRADVIVTLATKVIAGMKEMGMHAVIKHFPGHGSVSGDSHKMLPCSHNFINKVKQTDLQPFAKLIASNNISAVMTAHIQFPNCSSGEKVASLSRFWITDILKQNLGFDGLVFSDDMLMDAIQQKDNFDTILQAAQAGTDCILVGNSLKEKNSLRYVIDALKKNNENKENGKCFLDGHGIVSCLMSNSSISNVNKEKYDKAIGVLEKFNNNPIKDIATILMENDHENYHENYHENDHEKDLNKESSSFALS